MAGKEQYIIMPGDTREIPALANEKLTFIDGVSADVTVRRRKLVKRGFSLVGKILKETYGKIIEINLPETFTILKIKAVHHLSDQDK